MILQSPILAVVLADIIIFYVLGNFIQLPKITLPTTPLKVENVMPAIFTGTITATSILIGFFSVSAYNFRHWLQDEINKFSDTLTDVNRLYREAMEGKNELERLEKETKKEKELVEIGKRKVTINDQLKTCEELKELATLNRDAYAHQQEHLNIFILTFPFVSFYLLLGELLAFLVTPIIVGIFIDWTFVCLNGVFNGLFVFMWKFTTYTVHKEIMEERISPFHALRKKLRQRILPAP